MAKHADLEIGLGRRGGQDYVVEFRFTPPNSDSEDRPPRPGTLFASLIRGDDYNALRDTQGADLNYDYSPAADVNYHVEVYPRSGTGPYSLTITPLHKYDAFEPNDDILSAKTLSLGKTIDANIMDEKDVDFVRVKSRANGGNLTVTITNKSNGLALGVTIYDGEKNQLSSDYRDTLGAHLQCAFPVQPDSAYYVQVWPKAGSGPCSLNVK